MTWSDQSSYAVLNGLPLCSKPLNTAYESTASHGGFLFMPTGTLLHRNPEQFCPGADSSTVEVGVDCLEMGF